MRSFKGSISEYQQRLDSVVLYLFQKKFIFWCFRTRVYNSTISNSKGGWIQLHYRLYLHSKNRCSSRLGKIFLFDINNNTTVKLTGSSRRINPTTFQLPESRFIIPGNYQCVIESLNKFYKESMVSEIPMPGKHAEKISQILLSFLVCKNFKKRMILTL